MITMKINSVRIIGFLFIVLNLMISCKTDNVDGVLIGNTLLAHQSFSENQKAKQLISKALKKDKKAIISLKGFPNNEAAIGYDIGYVLTQIIYRIGENEFADILKEIPKAERKEFEGFIAVGLEYGDNDYDGKMDNKRIEIEFPLLFKMFKE